MALRRFACSSSRPLRRASAAPRARGPARAVASAASAARAAPPRSRRRYRRRRHRRRRRHLLLRPIATATESSTRKTRVRTLAGPTNNDPARNGCPVVRIEGGQIRIREQIQFKTASASIRKQSNYILEAVVKVLREHDDITKVRIEGHTDTRGKPAATSPSASGEPLLWSNGWSSTGYQEGRLSSEGFGQERPIATNLTDDGRQQNRRVEFHIVEGPGAEPSR